VAFSDDGAVHAVMMATPADLEDVATGFSLTEGIVSAPARLEGLEIVAHPAGLDARMWLGGARGDALATRRRTMAGPVGAGGLRIVRDRKPGSGAAPAAQAGA
jgi:FdhD protein